jgi:Amt family ammonium transporter
MANLPWVITATLIPLIALRGRIPAWGAAILGISVGAVLYPLVGNWIWGGGWLASLGSNLGYGRGFVDLGGSGLVHLLGGAVTLAGLLVFTERAPAHAIRTASTSFPPVHLPLLATLGAGLLLAGSVAWSAANPLFGADSGHLTRLALNTVLAAAAGSFLPLCYSWFVAGTVDPMMAVRGFAAGTVAIAAGAPLMPPWFALATGGCAGLLVLLAIFVVDRVLRWEDCTAALTVNGLAGALGLLAVGVFGLVLPGELQAIGGQPGSSPFLVSGTGQMQAQLAGVLAIALFAFLGAWVLIAPPAILARWARRGAARLPDGEVSALAIGSTLEPEALSDQGAVHERSSEGLAGPLSTRAALAPDGASEFPSAHD